MTALQSSGVVGARRYAPGQWLTVRYEATWRDAEVLEAASATHRLRFEGGGEASVALHPWNHAPRWLPADSFEEVREWHTRAMRAKHSHINDALTGRRLDSLEQCVAVDVISNAKGMEAVKDAHTMSAWLRALYEQHLKGDKTDRPPASLLTAGPAAGKTTLLSQLVAFSLEGPLIPILVKVQVLQRRRIDFPDIFASAWNWIDAFLRLEHGAEASYYCMLRQAMMARRALILIDGLDEAGQIRDEMERHVAEVLAPQGHVLLATSRPAGIDERVERDRKYITTLRSSY